MIEFFANLTNKPTATQFDGVKISTYNGGSSGPDRKFIGGILFLINPLLWLFKRRSEDPRGIYVRVWFPEPLNLDLNLEVSQEDSVNNAPSSSRLSKSMESEVVEQAEDTMRCFRWSAANDDMVVELLRGKAGSLLRRLSANYVVIMTDEFVQFGPIHGTPENSAAILGVSRIGGKCWIITIA